MKIAFDSTEVHTKSGTSERTGKPYSIREQAGYLDVGKRFPVSVRVPLGDSEPYAPGEYEVTQPLSVGRFERLEVARDMQLRRIEAKPAASRVVG